MIFSKEQWLEKDGMRDFVSTADEIQDHKFAVINGVHIDFVCYVGVDNSKINERHPSVDKYVILVHQAVECYNLSHAHKDFWGEKSVMFVHVFDKEYDAVCEFEHLIHLQLTK
jgi:hypothetical protein